MVTREKGQVNNKVATRIGETINACGGDVRPAEPSLAILNEAGNRHQVKLNRSGLIQGVLVGGPTNA